MIGRRVAGLAAIVSEMDPALIKELNEARIPAVFYDVGVQKQNITNIRVNYRRGIEKILEYLHSLGHRKLGFIGHHAVLEPINERLRTVKKAVTRYPSLEVRTAADADTLEGGGRRHAPCCPQLAEFCQPALTTVHIPRNRSVHIICSRLLPGDTEEESSNLEIVIDPELVVRESTGPAPSRRCGH